LWALVLCVLGLGLAGAQAQTLMTDRPLAIRGLKVTERLGEKVPLYLQLTDSEGRQVTLGDSFNQGKPVVLIMAYYRCPMLCSLVLDAAQQAFNELDYTVGKDFNVSVVSFNEKETTEEARERKTTSLAGYRAGDTPEAQAGWTFHTTGSAQAQALADALGFPFRYLSDSGQFAHPAVIFILTPDGRISRYLHGLSKPEGTDAPGYTSRDLKLALLEASDGKIGASLGDVFLNFCYHYDPKAGTYTLAAYNVMRLGAVATMLLLGSFVGILVIRERMRRRRGAGGRTPRGRGRPATGVGVTGMEPQG